MTTFQLFQEMLTHLSYHTVPITILLHQSNYTVSQKKHVTTFSTITLTISVGLQ